MWSSEFMSAPFWGAMTLPAHRQGLAFKPHVCLCVRGVCPNKGASCRPPCNDGALFRAPSACHQGACSVCWSASRTIECLTDQDPQWGEELPCVCVYLLGCVARVRVGTGAGGRYMLVVTVVSGSSGKVGPVPAFLLYGQHCMLL